MKKLIALIMSFQLILAPVALAQTASGQFESNPDGKSGGNYMEQILGISQAAVGSTVLMSCKMGGLLPSVKIYMAGSIVYIVSEITGGKSKNQELSKKVDDIKMVEEKMKKNGGGGGEVQKEALEQALKEQKDLLSFVKKRKMWLMAITAIYAAAMGFAIMEQIKLAACTAAMPICKPPTDLSPPLMLGACSPGGMPGAGLLAKAIPLAYSFGVGMTQQGALGKYGSMAAALLVTIPSVGKAVLSALNTPTGRIAVFGASTALVATIMMGLGKREGVINDNIKKLEAAIKNYEADTTNTNAIATGSNTNSGSMSGGESTAGATSGSGSGSSLTSLPSGDSSRTPVECLTSTSQGLDISSAGCSNPVRVTSPSIDPSLNVPTLASAATTAASMADNLSQGKTAAAEVEAGKLASMAARINQAKDNLLKQMNDQMVARGEKPIDLNSEVDKQLAGMNGAMNSALGTSGNSLANSGSLSGASQNAASLGEDLANKKDPNASGIQTATSSNVLGDAKSAPGAAGAGLGGMIGEGDVDPSAQATPEKQASLSESLNGYEMNEGDIAKDDGVSIFKQVSDRYILNYPKLFERKQIAPVPQPDPNQPK